MSFNNLLKTIVLGINLSILNTTAIASDAPRIISLSSALTEIIYDLDLEEQLVATGNSSKYPEAAIDLPKVGSDVMPEYELILSHQPDIVLTYSDSPNFEKRLKNDGIDLIVSNPKSIPEMFADWRTILKRSQTDQEKRKIAEEKIDKAETEWHGTVKKYKDKKPKSIFIMYSMMPLKGLNDKTFVGQALQSCNVQNIFGNEKQTHFDVDKKALVRKQPDFILHSYSDETEKSHFIKSVTDILYETGLETQPKQIISVNSAIFASPTMRFMQNLTQICEHIHTTQIN
ncbi:MAG: ABC transporter substrate-binding protein [Porphyromonadaceae bacterium]|jgi:ABC-type hemin transport system substrate-binding protein|nr:ABC transporter substrate-binding protein [Porphyromonadaceae bacterium]